MPVNSGLTASVSDARVRVAPSASTPWTAIIKDDASASVLEAQRRASDAASAFPAWSSLAPFERRRRLTAAADRIVSMSDQFAVAMKDEIGATRDWTAFNVDLAASMLREAAAMVTQVTGALVPSDRAGVTAMAIRQPVGVVLGIAPWNAPLALAVRSVAMPLACGNTTVLKASEVCPRTHSLVATALIEGGLGEGPLQVVTNDPADAGKVVEALVGHPSIRRVNFTGSTRVGKQIAELAARHLKPVLLELGGNATQLVLDDADLELAAEAALYGAFLNQGQICMSTERLIVDERVADAFVAQLVSKVAVLNSGSRNMSLGNVVGRDAIERLDSLLRDALAKGGRVVAGGRIDGTHMDATIVDHVTPNMRVHSEECFGPIVGVTRVQGEEEAIRVANDTEYGLASSVFTNDLSRGLRVASKLETGICHINGATIEDEPQMPFGGTKASGYGRFGGTAAVDEFTELRWVTYADKPRRYTI